MSRAKFLEVLQSLLTMVNPKSRTSIQCGKSALENIFAMAMDSKKCDAMTLRMMERAIHEFEYLSMEKKDFAGKPGDYVNNLHKRQRLEQMLLPGC